MKKILCNYVAGEVLAQAEAWIQKGIHPRLIIGGYQKALDDAMNAMEKFSVKVNVNDRQQMLKIIASSIGTKFVSRWSDLMCNLALEAVLTVNLEEDGRKEVDIKRYAKVEKVFPVLCR